MVSSFIKMAYVVGLWKAQVELWKNLALNLSTDSIPGRWRVIDIIQYIHLFASCTCEQIEALLAMLGRLQIHTNEDIQSSSVDSWIRFNIILVRIWGLQSGVLELTTNVLDTIMHIGLTNNFGKAQAQNWRWLDKPEGLLEFCITDLRVYSLLQVPAKLHNTTNRLWNRFDSTYTWEKCWSSLWHFDLPFDSQVFI